MSLTIDPSHPVTFNLSPLAPIGTRACFTVSVEKNWRATHFAATVPVSVTLICLCEEDPPDADNIPKPIIDALKGLAFEDDSQVTDLVSRRRYLRGTFRKLDRASAVLVGGFELGTEFVYVRVAGAPPQDELI